MLPVATLVGDVETGCRKGNGADIVSTDFCADSVFCIVTPQTLMQVNSDTLSKDTQLLLSSGLIQSDCKAILLTILGRL